MDPVGQKLFVEPVSGFFSKKYSFRKIPERKALKLCTLPVKMLFIRDNTVKKEWVVRIRLCPL